MRTVFVFISLFFPLFPCIPLLTCPLFRCFIFWGRKSNVDIRYALSNEFAQKGWISLHIYLVKFTCSCLLLRAAAALSSLVRNFGFEAASSSAFLLARSSSRLKGSSPDFPVAFFPLPLSWSPSTGSSFFRAASVFTESPLASLGDRDLEFRFFQLDESLTT